MEDRCTVVVRFPETELAVAGRAASNLREAVLDGVPGAQVELRKDDPTTQDFGATLVAVIGTPAIFALAQGIASWIRRRGQTIEIEVDGTKTTFRATGPIDDTAAKIAATLARRPK